MHDQLPEQIKTRSKKQVKLEYLSIRKIHTSNIYVSVSWTGKIPFIPFVGLTLDSLLFVSEKEDSNLIN